MLLERDMEDQIAADPKRFLKEDGLTLVERQPTFSGYRFDLVFRDRHNRILIVEVQKGTLDRVHAYKVVDYRNAYKNRHENERVDLMVVANYIPAERKQFLQEFGVSYREILEGEFDQPRRHPEPRPSITAEVSCDPTTAEPILLEKAKSDSAPAVGDSSLYLGDRTVRDHFGFAGYRACIATLYARPEGASQREVNMYAADLGSPQKDYKNMLTKARQWGHDVVEWDDEARAGRKGRVYKLIYNQNHSARSASPPPPNWEASNIPIPPPGAAVRPWNKKI